MSAVPKSPSGSNPPAAVSATAPHVVIDLHPDRLGRCYDTRWDTYGLVGDMRAEEWLQETGKSWDALHRCLSDGTTDLAAGAYPLSHTVLGGRQLYFGGDYYVCYRTGAQVVDEARALEPIDEAWLRQRYDLIDPADYQGVLGDEDFEYTWSWFGPIRDFHQRAAHAGRAIIFTVDQ